VRGQGYLVPSDADLMLPSLLAAKVLPTAISSVLEIN